jgi:ParB-like chromosome segregation protein Spo0J
MTTATKKNGKTKDDPLGGIRIEGDGQFRLVPLQAIEIVERPEPGREKDVLFFNCRSMDSFTQEKMHALYESIRLEGLIQPIVVRAFTENPSDDESPVTRVQLIAGERRFRSIDLLYKNNPLCFDRKRKIEVPARELYQFVTCNVLYNITDEEAVRINFLENNEHQSLTVKEEIELVERLTLRGLTQQEIVKLLSTNVTWVSQTGNFREELPPDAFAKLVSGQLTRHVAVKLLSYKKEDRQAAYEGAVEQEKAERAEAVERLDDEIAQASDEADMTATMVNIAEEQGDEAAAKRLAKKKETAEGRAKKAKAKKDRVVKEAGTIRQGHLTAGGLKRGVSPKKATCLTKGQIEQFYKELVKGWIEKGKQDPVTKNLIPNDVLEVMRATAVAILNGVYDPCRVARQIMVARFEWELPDGYEEKPLEPLTDVEAGDEELAD